MGNAEAGKGSLPSAFAPESASSAPAEAGGRDSPIASYWLSRCSGKESMSSPAATGGSGAPRSQSSSARRSYSSSVDMAADAARARKRTKQWACFFGRVLEGYSAVTFFSNFPFFGNQVFRVQRPVQCSPPGTRFAYANVWMIDINEYGSNFFELYHVVSSTPKSMTLMTSALFSGNVNVDGNKLMDKLRDARATNTPILNESTMPRRYMLKKDDRADYFVVGFGTAARRVRLNGTHPVTYILCALHALCALLFTLGLWARFS